MKEGNGETASHPTTRTSRGAQCKDDMNRWHYLCVVLFAAYGIAMAFSRLSETHIHAHNTIATLRTFIAPVVIPSTLHNK